MKLVTTGATGVAGLNIYRAALQDPSIATITLLIRREIPSWAVLPSNAAEKTTTIVHTDFTVYSSELASKLAEHDACIWALGKSAVGMSEGDYTTLTVEYPMAALLAIRNGSAGSTRPSTRPFRFVYVSGEGADPTEKSVQMWARVKGKAETAITAFCAPEPGMKAHILRPAYFRPPREYPADWQNQRSRAANVLDRIVSPIFSTLLSAYDSPMNELSQIPLEVAKGRWPDVELFRNKSMREFAKEL